MPTCDCPAAVIGVLDAQFVEASHEAFDVVGTEAEVAARHRVHELLHLEAGIQIAFGPVEFNVAVRQKVDVPVVAGGRAFCIDARVFFVSDGAEIKKRLVELGQPRQAVGAKVQVVELELHVSSSMESG